MPFHTNSIVFGPDEEDVYLFDDMEGRLQPKAEQMEIIARPGRDGEVFKKTGVRAPMSQIRTMHYVADWEAARDAMSAYVALIDGNAYEVIQHTTSYGYFRIHSVQEQSVRAVANVIGSIIPNPTVQQHVIWNLISTTEPAP